MLRLDGEAAFELSYWCGTCPFLFRRLDGADHTLSLEKSAARLEAGLDRIDGRVLAPYGALLAKGTYVPLLVEVEPQLVEPAAAGDYFTGEQAESWVADVWGPPESPQTPYYRTFQTKVSQDAHLFEFVVPMVPPSWNDSGCVDAYKSGMRNGVRPTAVAVTTLDVCRPEIVGGVDECAHWGLTHFLLDGHHKLQAAAETGSPVRLLSLLALDACLADREQIDAALRARRRPASTR